MKTLENEKMEKIEGGIPSLDQGCQMYGMAFADDSGATIGSVEFAILASIAYTVCWEGLLGI